MNKIELLEESHQQLKIILNEIGQGVTIIDKDLRIVWANAVIENWAGSLEIIKGKHCYKTYQQRESPCENCPGIKAFDTGSSHRARQYVYDTCGNIKYFEFSSVPLKDEAGEITAVAEFAIDLTEKVQLEHKLKETKDRLQAIFDGISDGISVIDKKYQILRVNQGILKLFGKHEFSQFLGDGCFRKYFKNEGICDNCPALRTFQEGESFHITKILSGTDKKRLILDISTFPIKGDNGEVIHVIEYMRDVTNTVKLEDQLLYQERLAGIGEIAAGIAHEIRNPLGNITASSQFCLSKYKLHKLAQRHLKVILRNAEVANRIIMDLLEFAKPREIIFTISSVTEQLENALNLVKTRFSKQRVRLAKRFSRQLPKILLDERRIEEVFVNLLINSLDAMPEGGKLYIGAYPDFKNKEVVINFSDTGGGILPENFNKVFDPFFTTKKSGTGLGLSLVAQIVSCHKGNIDINSKYGKGTEITVRIPILREKE
ncbi:MAG: ATP-binding protein [Candidatus Omnitrophota bacterium]